MLGRLQALGPEGWETAGAFAEGPRPAVLGVGCHSARPCQAVLSVAPVFWVRVLTLVCLPAGWLWAEAWG